MRRHASRVGGLLGVLALGSAVAGCGGAIPSSNGAAGVRLQSNATGRYLVDAQGHALYLFEKDEPHESYCSGACAAVWPPFESESTPKALAGITPSNLGIVKRDDGESQVTYDGHPLYYYAADASTPGRTKGEEAHQFGAEWYLVSRSGKPLESHDSGSTTTTTTNGGGY